MVCLLKLSRPVSHARDPSPEGHFVLATTRVRSRPVCSLSGDLLQPCIPGRDAHSCPQHRGADGTMGDDQPRPRRKTAVLPPQRAVMGRAIETPPRPWPGLSMGNFAATRYLGAAPRQTGPAA